MKAVPASKKVGNLWTKTMSTFSILHSSHRESCQKETSALF